MTGGARRGGGRRPSRAERRQQLLDDAVEAIRRVGSGASMDQLARQGGVTKPILYRHFGDRDGLVDAIGARYASSLLARLGETLDADDPRALLRQTVDGYLAFLEDDPELYSFLSRQAPGPRHDAQGRSREPSSLADAVGREVAIVIGDRLRARGLDDAGAEPMAYGIVGMVHHAGDWWIRTRTMSRGLLTDHLTDLLWRGFQGMAADAVADPPAGDPV